MEHRYYGESFPVKNLTTESFRFLTTQQALADQAYFAQHVKFEGMEDMDLTAPGTPYLTYGGSYSGAFVAFMRVEYPELYWGAISSSGVTEAIYDFWEYNEPIREYGPPMCVAAHQKLLNVVDTVLMKENKTLTMELKTTMGMEGLTNDKDFANVAGYAFQYWQNRNWDPQVDDLTFDQYCGNITSQEKTFPVKTTPLTKNVTAVLEQSAWANETKELTIPMLNYIGWINETFLATCEGSISECWGESNATSTMYTDKSLDNYDILSWPYQWCTEWGYLVTGTGVPKDELPLTSRLMDLEYLTSICRYAFNITKPPDTAIINKYGGFNISYPRLALIGGQADPWRPSTPLATLDKPDRLNTTSTTSQPVILIEGAVHHWDEVSIQSKLHFRTMTYTDILPEWRLPQRNHKGSPTRPCSTSTGCRKTIRAAMDGRVQATLHRKSKDVYS